MKRRKFVASSAAIGATTISASSLDRISNPLAANNEVYELRTYEISFGGNRGSLMTYLSDLLLPTLTYAGANHAQMFKEVGDPEPSKIWVMVSYPSMDIYQKCLEAQSADAFILNGKDHADAGKTYNRYVSSLSTAFNGLPQMRIPGDEKTLFELRIYEGPNDDAVRRKVAMFDDEEIALFDKVGLDSVFFGKMVIGPYMPCLVYMLAHDDMAERGAAWGRFVASDEWNTMKSLPKYANTISNIQKIFLEKI